MEVKCYKLGIVPGPNYHTMLFTTRNRSVAWGTIRGVHVKDFINTKNPSSKWSSNRQTDRQTDRYLLNVPCATPWEQVYQTPVTFGKIIWVARAKGFYLLLYPIAHRTFKLSSFELWKVNHTMKSPFLLDWPIVTINHRHKLVPIISSDHGHFYHHRYWI